MAFDGLVFRRVTQLIAAKVTGARIERIGNLSNTDFVFELYQQGQHLPLLISTNPTASYFTFIPDQKFNFLTPEHFTNLLKIHLDGGVIQSIKQVNLDRILEIVIAKRDDIGDLVTKKVYLEFLGRMTNLILTKDDNKIIDALHRMGPNEATKRTLCGGAPYRIPPLKPMQDPLTASYNPNVGYASQFYGVSTLLEADWSSQHFEAPEVHAFVDKVLHSEQIYIGKANGKTDYHFQPLSIFGTSAEAWPWDKGIAHFYETIREDKQKNDRGVLLLNLLKKEIQKAQKKLGNLDDDYQKATLAPRYKEYGDLLYTYADQNSEGLKEIVINGNKISLNSQLSISQNANHYFEKYHKSKNALDIIAEQMDICKQQLAYFELLEIQIQDADDATLQEIKVELAAQGLIHDTATRNPRAKKNQKQYNTMKFVSPDGVKIEVGRNNIQNDYLTFNVARYNEYFFHVKDFPGAHVLVHSTEPLQEATIRMAANLAAYYSKARFSSTVPVDYTLIKNIKKPKAYKFGQVLMTSNKTIYIDPVDPTKSDTH